MAEETEENTKPEGKKKKGVVREYVEAILFALIIALTLRYFVLEAFRIPSASMVPTLLVGDHIFVNKFIYGLRIPFTNKKVLDGRKPDRGEIIVFIYPHDPSKDYIKRVVGVAGDQVEVKNDHLYLNGKPVSSQFSKDYLYQSVNQRCVDFAYDLYEEKLGDYAFEILNDRARLPSNFGPKVVGENELFVMGDNRDNSSDSRVWGMVPMENVKGKALFIWLSLNRCGTRADSLGGRLGRMATFQWMRFNRLFTDLH